MGGRGSGNWYRWRTKRTTGSCWALNINILRRDGCLAPGAWAIISWGVDGETRASIGVRRDGAGLELVYTVTVGDAQPEDVRQRVPLDWTDCHYGGARPWFICPGCGERTGKLYLGGRRFFCRRCCGLVYQSQQESPRDRALHRAQQIRHRLGGSGSMAQPFPAKPPRMHWRTYRRLRLEHDEADAETWWHVAAWLDRHDRWFAHRFPEYADPGGAGDASQEPPAEAAGS
jgi:hypothetical protein